MRILILLHSFLFLVFGGAAGAQVKELTLSGCVRKSASGLNNILNKMTQTYSNQYIANKDFGTIVEIQNSDGSIKSYTYKLLNINSGYAEGIKDNGIRRDVKNQPFEQEWINIKLFYDQKEVEVTFNYKDLKTNTTKENKYEYLCTTKKSN